MSLFQFMESVATVIPDKWKKVGVSLGLCQPQINAIDAQHRGDPLDCFAEVFHLWQQLSTPQQPVSWTTLVTMLRSRTVGEELLANNLQEHFIDNH